ncbi:2-hydroxyacid dehydrogenase [Albidovulum sp.]|uniref:2-hydroxyacid dehydrogenase n=1 Tax=Albidovulum sp. TaxID=1872424 RepID=UPI0039B954A4
MTRPRVLVTRAWPESVEAELARRFEVTLNREDEALGPERIGAALGEFDAILPTVTDRLGADLFDRPGIRTRILANYGVGFAHIATAAAAAQGIAVTNTPDVLSDCTADLAMTLLLMVARRAGEGERELRAGRWSGWRPTHMIGTAVTGKTLGIVGFGRIGQALAARAKGGFGMRVLVQNRSAVTPAVLAAHRAEQVESLEALLPECDFVSLHCPGGAANRNLLDAGRLALMRRGAILVNTARGEVVDEAALAAALHGGRIGGAGLDVYAEEPLVPEALLSAPNTVLLPHLGSATAETREAMGMRVIANLDDFFAGRPPRDRVA